MRLNRLPLRAVTWLATSSLCLTATAPALAQPAPLGGEDQAGNQGTDPPALAGRVAVLSGSVSFHAAGETEWTAATLNYPVTSGSAFWTEPRAAATLEIADGRLVMDKSTEFDIAVLDQDRLTGTEPQGAVFLQLPSLPFSRGVSFDTPRGTVQISAPGRYEIVAGNTNDATSVTVVEGAAHVTGANLSLDIGPQQTATINGSETLQGSVGAMQQDAFLQSQTSVPTRRIATALPAQARYMTGVADLQEYGSFSQTTQYGQIWYPSGVSRDWAPYREGHWAYVQPWGWTWVDNARWGFAPFHYGRWVQVDDRWGWIAGGGEVAEASFYPVYSPALVSFVDVSGAALAGAAIGFAAAELASGYAPAWIPLGPREPYYPWYHCRPDYFGRVNRFYGVPRDIIARGPTYINNVTNIRQVNINQTSIFINRRAATFSPVGAFARGQSMVGVARPLPERWLAQARPVVGRLPVRPTAFTPNLPPATARRFNVTLPVRPIRSVTAGPQIEPGETGRTRPMLRPAALPGNVRVTPGRQLQGRVDGQSVPVGVRQPNGILPALRPAENRAAERGSAIATRGHGGLPALRAPGERPDAVSPGRAAVGAARGGAERTRGVGAVVPRTERGVRPDADARPPAHEQRVQGQESRPGPISPSISPPRTETAKPERRGESLRREPRAETPRPMLRPTSRVEPPHPAARPEVPRPPVAPRAEAPRRSPQHTEVPRPAPRLDTSRPSPRLEAPAPRFALEPAPASRPTSRPTPSPGKYEPSH